MLMVKTHGTQTILMDSTSVAPPLATQLSPTAGLAQPLALVGAWLRTLTKECRCETIMLVLRVIVSRPISRKIPQQRSPTIIMEEGIVERRLCSILATNFLSVMC